MLNIIYSIKNLIVVLTLFIVNITKVNKFSFHIKMDIINHYDIVTYKEGDLDKYTYDKIWHDCTIYYMNKQRHRDNDQPAVIGADGTQIWYVNGQQHRDNDKPSYINPKGAKLWYLNGIQEWWG